MRSPCNVLVVPYLRSDASEYYCVFKRRDIDIWQFVSGGIEDNESPAQAAIREFLEEAGIHLNGIRLLKTQGSVPANCFSMEVQAAWGTETIIIPVYCFAAEVRQAQIHISYEHTECRWVDYDTALTLLHFDPDKTAAYEARECLFRNIWP